MKIWLQVASSVLIVAPLGCGGDIASSGRAQVQDSAGIQIVTLDPSVLGHDGPWHLSEPPIISIGTVEGSDEDQLFRVVGATRLRDGSLVVANSGSSELRFYDVDGSHVRTVGRSGEGPGEFLGMYLLDVFRGDSLWVYDIRTTRATVFATSGELVRSYSLSRAGLGSVRPLELFQDGSVLVSQEHTYSFGEEESGVRRPPVVLHVVNSEGAHLDTIGEFPGSEAFVQTDANTLSVGTFEFGKRPVVSTTPEGFYFSSTDRSDVLLHSHGGALVRVLRLGLPRRPVSEADIARAREERLASTTEPRFRALIERSLQTMPFPDSMPAFSDLTVDEEANVWIEQYRAWDTEPSRWFVFDPSGEFRSSVGMPPGFDAFEIGGDYVLGRRTDELGVERVELYGLERPSPDRPGG